jgi:hypothetical protein
VPGSEEHTRAQGEAQLIIAKQRNGPTDTLNLTWQREYTRFRSWSPREAPTYSSSATPYEQLSAPRGVDAGAPGPETGEEAPF